jgi:hypothetical protein
MINYVQSEWTRRDALKFKKSERLKNKQKTKRKGLATASDWPFFRQRRLLGGSEIAGPWRR